MNNKVSKIILTVLGVMVIAFIMVWLETGHRAKEAFNEGEKEYKKKDYDMAVVWYGSTIRFYTPGSKWVKKAKERIFEIGKMYEEQGKYKESADTYGEVVHGIYAIRSFYTPHQDWQKQAMKKVEECKEKIKNKT
ncbi:MAG: hypothetical protein QME42_07505 [bacterium]|nr:hypothetical protein [bacterium]